jgi:hypothetical protein
MTAFGVTGYLVFLGENILALISGIVFAKVIVFHFIMDYYDKKNSKLSDTFHIKYSLIR